MRRKTLAALACVIIALMTVNDPSAAQAVDPIHYTLRFPAPQANQNAENQFKAQIEATQKQISLQQYKLSVILDELNIALRYDYLDLDQVIAALKARRPGLHVVVTGRNAKAPLIEVADLVTEMTLVKHHFAAGVKAQEGIEF